MADKNKNEQELRFNGSKLHRSNNIPSTINWSILKDNLNKRVNSENRSMWGFIQDQDKRSKNK